MVVGKNEAELNQHVNCEFLSRACQMRQRRSGPNLKTAGQRFFDTTEVCGNLEAVGEEVGEVLEAARENLILSLLLILLSEGRATSLAACHERV